MFFSQFTDYINGFSGERPQDQRLGQWAFNLLAEAYPKIANQIRATKYDPFYVDNKMPVFLCRLLEKFVIMDDKEGL
jgi:hypothetical protein